MSDEDVAWLEARERGEAVGALPRAAQYERLQHAIRSLPVLRSPDAWERRVLAEVDAAVPAVRPGRRRRRFAVAIAVPLLAAAAAVLLWLVLRRSDEPPVSTASLQIEVRRGAEIIRVGATAAAIGDTLVIRGDASEAAELRIYRDQMLVVRCPAAAACRGSSSAELRLEVPGSYRALLILDQPAAPAGTLAEDLAGLQRANARAVTAPTIAVH